MPNNGRITKCPFYRDEKNLSISCEDIVRTFRWPAQKKRHMDSFCDDKWQECPVAQRLNELYKEDGVNRVHRLSHDNEELKKELRKVKSMLGKCQKREAKKDEEIRALRKECGKIEQHYFAEREKNKNAKEAEERMISELSDIGKLYEARFAYLMAVYADGTMSETDFKRWADENEYAITADTFGKSLTGREVVETWRVHARKIGEGKRDEHRQCDGPATEVQETGRGETGGEESENETDGECENGDSDSEEE